MKKISNTHTRGTDRDQYRVSAEHLLTYVILTMTPISIHLHLHPAVFCYPSPLGGVRLMSHTLISQVRKWQAEAPRRPESTEGRWLRQGPRILPLRGKALMGRRASCSRSLPNACVPLSRGQMQ